MGGYGPSKAATRSLSGCVRAELAGQGTQVTALIVGTLGAFLSYKGYVRPKQAGAD